MARSIPDSSVDVAPSRLASGTTAGGAFPWAADGSASACGARQNAAATPASTGTATVDSRRGVRRREYFLWQPKGLLSGQGALTLQAAPAGGRLTCACN